MEISFTTLSQQQEHDHIAINICGTPCVGDCRTCVQSNADLSAFYGLPQETVAEVQMMAYAGDEESEDRALEEAKAMDQIEEAQRSGEAYDHDEGDYYEDENSHEFGCHCYGCVNYEDERGYDDGYGLDWNESGYFD